MSTKAIVLHSGGLDSTLCLVQAQRRLGDVVSLGIDYGQKHRIELAYATRQCERFQVPRKVLRVEWDKPELEIPSGRSIDEMRREVSPAFLPGRNAVFLALACAEAAGIGASEVWLGVNAVDFSGYPDCRPEFISAFRKMIQRAMPPGIKIVAPLLHLSKPQIARRAHRAGLRRGDVWCCYRPVNSEAGPVPCGKCDACLLHEHAWAEAFSRRSRAVITERTAEAQSKHLSEKRRICLVSCVSSKCDHPVAARELYTSPLFRGAKHFAETRFDRWYILSAEHGLVHPDHELAPYEKTLKKMSKSERLKWSEAVVKSLRKELRCNDEVAFVAGECYREFVVPRLTSDGICTQVPLEGMSIGRQLAWFKKLQTEHDRLRHLDLFYSLLQELEKGLNGKRRLRECTGSSGWPQMGVYFFFEDRELRTTSIRDHRVVRVGTHAVSKSSKTTLWQRLRTHRGGVDGTGNHRGSIFRLHAGAALLAQSGDSTLAPTWGQGQSASRNVRESEAGLEHQVSKFTGDMSLLWLAVEDDPGPGSDRAYIERNAIGLMAGPTGPMDLPSPGWLGRHSPKRVICDSGLWNLNHVGDSYDPRFLEILGVYVAVTLGQRRSPRKSLAPKGWHDFRKNPDRQTQPTLFPKD